MENECSSASRIGLVLVEDESLYRDLLGIVLGERRELSLLGAFADSSTALRTIPSLNPRVVLLDIELPGGLNGIELGLQLRRRIPGLGVVLLSNHESPQFINSLPESASAGWSYLLKKSVGDADTLVRAIKSAASGLVVLDPGLVRGLRPRRDGTLARLAPRQREILDLMAQGFTNAGIARRLTITEKSVENQTNLLYQTLQIDRRATALHPRVKAVLIYLQESTYLQERLAMGNVASV